MITGKQIKDNTVTTKDIKNRTIAVKDLSRATKKKLAGAPGPAGAVGPSGPAGPRGFSVWDTIPSGTTVTGRFFDQGRASTPVAEVIENIELPAKAPSAPTALGFGSDTFAATTTDAACTGSYSAPTAPAGRVCVYVDVAGITSASVLAWDDAAHRPYTFYLSLTPSAGNVSYGYAGSWAYTAP